MEDVEQRFNEGRGSRVSYCFRVFKDFCQHMSFHLWRCRNAIQMQDCRGNIIDAHLQTENPGAPLDSWPHSYEKTGDIISILEVVFGNNRCVSGMVSVCFVRFNF